MNPLLDSVSASIIWDMIIFDWDGTAVPDRHSPIGDLKVALERLLKEGGLCAIVTGTNLDNILKQGIAKLSPLAKHGLHVCTNRGSEVYDFDSSGQPRLIFRRQATQAENRALDNAAIDLHDRVKAQGMRTEITFDRLNRRKIDLIPEPEWTSPKKARFRELLSAVETRMAASGLSGGIPSLIKEAEEISHKAGLSNPKITSDIKHIEIGLTDKSDSATWIARSIIGPDKIPLSHVSVWGDELGSLGSLPGSDALMRTSELREASFFSVGVEPEGVPSWVHALGGGPDRFIEFLHQQADLRRDRQREADLRPSQDPSWILEQEGFDPSRERLMESLFAISNGNLGIRGTSDLPIPAAQADLFVAGVYDQRVPTQAYSETELFDSSKADQCTETEIVPLPFPFHIRFRIDGIPLRAKDVNRLECRRTLDFKKGVYFEHNILESSQGRRTRLSSFRICSLADPHLLIQKLKITSENYSAHLEIDLSLLPNEFAELYPHLRIESDSASKQESRITQLQVFKTKGSCDSISLAARALVNGRELHTPRVSAHLAPGESLIIERIISVFSGKDARDSLLDAVKHSKSQPLNLASCVTQHLAKWEEYWSLVDLNFPGAQGLTDAQRFNLYHLKSSAALSPETSIPAKALTGRAYEGHVFWDTEIFMFPFFLYTEPETARELLLYRYNTLPGARKRATEMGFRGACYAWESSVTGKDVTPSFISVSGTDSKIPIFTGTQQIHVTADIAWAVSKYWDATLDEPFMLDFGAEILLETARFWASRVVRVGARYHLKEVVGPDEYHHGVTDNAYTNYMVHHNLRVAIETAGWLKKKNVKRHAELSEKLNLSPDEIASWRNVMARLYLPLPGTNGVIEQFQGFFGLKSVPLSKDDKTHAPISRLFDWEEINRTQIVKQADVLMIPFLFPDLLPSAVIKANYDFYEPITDHGSSLSPCVHGAIAARIGKGDDALRYWKESLYFDLRNTMSNSQLGIHAAALGGTWLALVFHLLGVRPSESGFVVDTLAPDLIPSAWNGLKLKLKYRDRTYSLVLVSGKLVEMTQEAA